MKCPGCGSETDYMLFPMGKLSIRNCFKCGDETVVEA